jgi:hypothetical protein
MLWFGCLNWEVLQNSIKEQMRWRRWNYWSYSQDIHYKRDIKIRGELNIYNWNYITAHYREKFGRVKNTRYKHSQVSVSKTSPEKWGKDRGPHPWKHTKLVVLYSYSLMKVMMRNGYPIIFSLISPENYFTQLILFVLWLYQAYLYLKPH